MTYQIGHHFQLVQSTTLIFWEHISGKMTELLANLLLTSLLWMSGKKAGDLEVAKMPEL